MNDQMDDFSVQPGVPNAFKLIGAAAIFALAGHASAPAAGQTTGDAASNVDGEVRKIDKDARKITLKHGEIKNLEMPAMTMVFQVKDASFLDKVKTGDRVKFKAEKVSGGFAVTEIELAK